MTRLGTSEGLKPVRDLSPGDEIRSHGCILRVLSKPAVSSDDDPFGRDMYVFQAEIIRTTSEAPKGKRAGDKGKLVYGLEAQAVMN